MGNKKSCPPCKIPNEVEMDPRCRGCNEKFTKRKPPLCLPCVRDSNHLGRHCPICRDCLQEDIEKAKGTESKVTCRVCGAAYDPKILEAAIGNDCLSFPKDKKLETELHGWDRRETEPKRQCLENLRDEGPLLWTAVYRAPWSKREIEIHTLQSSTMAARLDLFIHTKKEGVSERIQRLENVFIPEPEMYVKDWSLRYAKSASHTPFPNNIGEVLHGIVSVPMHRKNPTLDEKHREEVSGQRCSPLL